MISWRALQFIPMFGTFGFMTSKHGVAFQICGRVLKGLSEELKTDSQQLTCGDSFLQD